MFGIDPGELVIDAAGLGAAVEPGQRLAEIVEAVGGALALRIVLVIGEQHPGGGRRLVVVEIGAALEVAHPARPAGVGIARRGRVERGRGLGIVMLVPEPEAGIVGLLGAARGGRRRPRGSAAAGCGRGEGRAGVAAGRLGDGARRRLEPLDPAAQVGAQPGDLILDLAAAVVRFLDLAGQRAQLRLERVDPRGQARQGVAGDVAAGRGAGLRRRSPA